MPFKSEKQRGALNTLVGELQPKKSALKDSDKDWLLTPQNDMEKDMLNRELTGDYEKNKDRLNDLGITSMEEYEEFINKAIGLKEGGIARLGYANGQLVQPGLGRPGYAGDDDWDEGGDTPMPGGGRGSGHEAAVAATGGGDDGPGPSGLEDIGNIKKYTGPDQKEEVARKIAEESKKYKKEKTFKPFTFIKDKYEQFKRWNDLKKRTDFLKSKGRYDLLEDEEWLLSAAGKAKLDSMDYQEWLWGPGGGPGLNTGGGGEGQGTMQTATLPIWQQQGFNSYADWLATQQGATGTTTPATQQAALTGQLGGINTAHHPILANIYGVPEANFLNQYPMFAADGGRAGYAGGGDVRQEYFLGGLGKIFKKATKSIKKLGKSKLGKAAMMAALYHYGPRVLTGGMGDGFLGKKGTGWGDLIWKTTDDAKRNVNLARMFGIPMALGAFTADEDDDKSLGYDWEAKKAADDWWIPKFDQSNFRRIASAQGGRIGYDEGKKVLPQDHRTAALRAMYGIRSNAQEGGLMDMGGMEKDYRQEGGFVPIGGQERADDVPARLSKNEFVFTADAVRAAGGGDIDAGAEIMENVMENLEQGGQVSEESQGLEGARNMFATAQRLEGVL